MELATLPLLRVEPPAVLRPLRRAGLELRALRRVLARRRDLLLVGLAALAREQGPVRRAREGGKTYEEKVAAARENPTKRSKFEACASKRSENRGGFHAEKRKCG